MMSRTKESKLYLVKKFRRYGSRSIPGLGMETEEARMAGKTVLSREEETRRTMTKRGGR